MASQSSPKEKVSTGIKYTIGERIRSGPYQTNIFCGTYDYRKEVAFKSFKREQREKAERIIHILCQLDEHPNIIKFYGRVEDLNNIYIVMERCQFDLKHLIDTENRRFMKENKEKKINMWENRNGVRFPTEQNVQLLREIMIGLSYIHDKKIIHRDLVPNNILLKFQDESLCVKISGFNISSKIEASPSFDYNKIGHATYGWMSKEVLERNQQTTKMDVFCLTLLIFYCLSGGGHAFGKSCLNWEEKIKKGEYDISAISHLPEARHLLEELFSHYQLMEIKDIQKHPFFWNAKKRIHFLQKASARAIKAFQHSEVAKKINLHEKSIRDSFYSMQSHVFQATWKTPLHQPIQDYIDQSSRKIRDDQLHQLLRTVRNMYCHFADLDSSVKSVFDNDPSRVLKYFSEVFPDFFITVYEVIKKTCSNECSFAVFF